MNKKWYLPFLGGGFDGTFKGEEPQGCLGAGFSGTVKSRGAHPFGEANGRRKTMGEGN